MAGSLTRQIYDRLRTAILSGALPRGYRLPSSRVLAEDFDVSRNTVSTVIDQLAVEGYIVVARGRRPVVAAVEKMQLVSGDQSPDHEPSGFMRVSRWARQVSRSDWHFTNEGGSPRPFAPGLADAREFPHEVWARCLRRAARSQACGGNQGQPSGASRGVAQPSRGASRRQGRRAQADHYIVGPGGHRIDLRGSCSMRAIWRGSKARDMAARAWRLRRPVRGSRE